MNMWQVTAQEQGSEGWWAQFCIHMRWIQMASFWSRRQRFSEVDYSWFLLSFFLACFFQRVDNSSTMTTAQQPYTISGGEVKDEGIAEMQFYFRCQKWFVCGLLWKPYPRRVSVISFCQQGTSSTDSDSLLWLQSCTLNAICLVYTFISTSPSAVTLMNGSWNWPIVFTWRDEWTQTSSLSEDLRRSLPFKGPRTTAVVFAHMQTPALPPDTFAVSLIRVNMGKCDCWLWFHLRSSGCFMPNKDWSQLQFPGENWTVWTAMSGYGDWSCFVSVKLIWPNSGRELYCLGLDFWNS